MQSMRHWLVVPVAFAAALVAAAPAFAQRASLADRVAALEARSNDTSANMDLLNQVTQLRQEILALRSQVEDLQQQNEQLKSSNRSQYLDIDGRLNRLEGGGGTGGGGGMELPEIGRSAVESAPRPTPPTERPPTVHGTPGLIAGVADERAAYDQAFDALRNGNYAESARRFQAFLDQHPQGSYAPNALYWLGESYYATRNFELAQAQFRDLVARYPTHDKAAGGLLKIGLSQYGEGKVDQAQQTLETVVAQYPGSDAARTAQDRLQSIRLGRQIR